ncbi:MAG TPA: YraN family protein [Burkholderiaceae bacterium]|nr:YraN family protein [Burkholderiaceae bacterium]
MATATKESGDAGEARALAHLLAQGLTLVQRNYRVARGPHARGGEIDLILRERDGTLVFAEVRARRGGTHGGAAASVGAAKQRSLIFAAQHFLRTQRSVPPCRFDVVAIDGDRIEWLRGAFDAS